MTDVCAVCDEPVAEEPHYSEEDGPFHWTCCPHPMCQPVVPRTPHRHEEKVRMPPNADFPCKCHTMEQHQACEAPCLPHPDFTRPPWPPPHNDAPGSPAWWASLAVHYPTLKTVEMPCRPKEGL